jgi:uncharacterized protein involved in exopolysaccharide biosynthesis
VLNGLRRAVKEIMADAIEDEASGKVSECDRAPRKQYSDGLYYEVSLPDFVVMLLKGSWILVIVLAGGLALATWWIKSTSPTYTVEMVVAPASGPGQIARSSGPTISSFAAGLLGGGISSAPIPRYEQFLHLITSVPMAERLEEKYGLLQIIKAENWDAENQRWVRPPPNFRSKVKQFFGLPAWTAPNIGALADFLRDTVSISPVDNTSYRRISIEHSDPEFALTLLIWLYEEAEEMLRDKSMISTLAQIRYIEKQLAKVTIADHRLGLIALLSEQEKTMMLADGGAAFSAEVTELPVIPNRPTSPRPVSTLVAAALASIAFGVVLVFVLNMALGNRLKARRKHKRQAPKK